MGERQAARSDAGGGLEDALRAEYKSLEDLKAMMQSALKRVQKAVQKVQQDEEALEREREHLEADLEEVQQKEAEVTRLRGEIDALKSRGLFACCAAKPMVESDVDVRIHSHPE
mmetsp:Transcript_132302/g.382502  ORF Transcript_132302/g.382502 Transcript_132302/m.382502 type:complete len:114 (-) Transcript_132302:70-411(-)|eukprot:CAMPEP_0176064960 /NCGR_PEP_ID=MMETSP0120_2-20121206/32404_1 /TAXON_ID=160619 /ORGANISM="Kryptoperidinium foliaceum, Strain CCMP 1326" /LENGTH=113 /DNA_ID=CAMNT_0017398541 /DNA_START=136 /DNA_END=477 /DNA_ORIENTATION=-